MRFMAFHQLVDAPLILEGGMVVPHNLGSRLAHGRRAAVFSQDRSRPQVCPSPRGYGTTGLISITADTS